MTDEWNDGGGHMSGAVVGGRLCLFCTMAGLYGVQKFRFTVSILRNSNEYVVVLSAIQNCCL
jgi:hypothetical protein